MKPSSLRRRVGQVGFTLVEILVALMVMAVLSVLAFQAFDGILALESRSKQTFLQENRRSLAVSIMLNDFLHMRARPVRDQLGGLREAYLAPSGDYVVEFTRGGLPDFDSMAGGIQRLAYRAEGGRLLRTTWQTADAGPTLRPEDQILATGIRDLRVEQLDSTNRFAPLWPPVNEGAEPGSLPPMVRITLATEEGDEIRLLVPGPDASGVTPLGAARD